MNPDSTHIRPIAAPNDLEWAFEHGQPSIVAHIPDGEGNYSVIALDQIAPTTTYEREHVRALLRIAEHNMAISEESSTTGVGR